MNSILMTLQEFNFSELSNKPLSKDCYTERDIKNLKQLDKYTEDYLNTHPYHLASVVCAMQLALEDEDAGTFDKAKTQAMAYYLEEEINTLGTVISMRNTVLFCLKEAENGKGE